jgi:hypothetical protein
VNKPPCFTTLYLYAPNDDNKSMGLVRRLGIWTSCAVLVVALDVITKASPHDVMAANHAHTATGVYVVVGCFLVSLVAWRSPLLAVGGGLMFGALVSNAGQLLLQGYATDWIPVAGWLTNVADIAGAVGLLVCLAGYLRGANVPQTRDAPEH